MRMFYDKALRTASNGCNGLHGYLRIYNSSRMPDSHSHSEILIVLL